MNLDQPCCPTCGDVASYILETVEVHTPIRQDAPQHYSRTNALRPDVDWASLAPKAWLENGGRGDREVVTLICKNHRGHGELGEDVHWQTTFRGGLHG